MADNLWEDLVRDFEALLDLEPGDDLFKAWGGLLRVSAAVVQGGAVTSGLELGSAETLKWDSRLSAT